MADLSKIIKLTSSQYDTLASGGEISKGGQSYTYDSSAMYLVEQGGVGSLTQPIYIDSNGNYAATSYTLGTSVPSDAVFTDHTYNFSGTTFVSGNGDYGTHNANDMRNGHFYYNSNGPTTSIGASTSDGALYSQAYSDSWIGQIAQDYRNGNLFVRGKNNGTWQSWKRIANVSDISNATITIKQTGIGDQTFTLNGASATISLADTNTWRGIKTKSGVDYIHSSEYSDTDSISSNFLRYWNGRISGGTSNLQYCDRGRFGTIVTASSTDYALTNHTHDYLPLTGGDISNTNFAQLTIKNTSGGKCGLQFNRNGNTSWDMYVEGGNFYLYERNTSQVAFQLNESTQFSRAYIYEHQIAYTTDIPTSLPANGGTSTYTDYVNQVAISSANDAVPGEWKVGLYNGQTDLGAGGGDGYIMAWRWAGKYVTQVYLDVDPTYKLAVRYRDGDGNWKNWKDFALVSGWDGTTLSLN